MRRLDVKPDCRLSDYIQQSSLNAYCWMHQPECPHGRIVLHGLLRWWVWNDGTGLLAIAVTVLVVLGSVLGVALALGGGT